jgi:hypothetical protein
VAVVLPAAGVGGSGWVLDLDSVLPFPCPGADYVRQAFRPHEDILPEYRQYVQPCLEYICPYPHAMNDAPLDVRLMWPAVCCCRCFRVLSWGGYRDCFASDRSHMRRPDGTWNAPPPAYPPIVGAKAASVMTLPQLWDTTVEGQGMGSLLSLQAFQHFLCPDTA